MPLIPRYAFFTP